MTFYNDSHALEANTLQSAPPANQGDSFESLANVFNNISPSNQGDTFAINTQTVAGRQSNSLDFTFILPVTPEAQAYAYIYENVQLSSREVLTAATITQNVTNDIPMPHIWYVIPDEANRGEIVAVVGTGFGETQETFNGYVTFGPTLPTVQSWVNVVTSLTPISERLIQHWLDVADPEHQRITFAVPNNAVSGEVRVITNTDDVVQPPPAPPVAKFDEDSASAAEAESASAAIADGDVAAAAETELLSYADKFGSDSGAGAEGEVVEDLTPPSPPLTAAVNRGENAVVLGGGATSMTCAATPAGGGLMLVMLSIGMEGGVESPINPTLAGLGGTWIRLGSTSTWGGSQNFKLHAFVSTDYVAGAGTLTATFPAMAAAGSGVMIADEVTDGAVVLQHRGTTETSGANTVALSLLADPAATSLVWGAFALGNKPNEARTNPSDAATVSLAEADAPTNNPFLSTVTGYKVGADPLNFDCSGNGGIEKNLYIVEVGG